jgi:hypothetical protein
MLKCIAVVCPLCIHIDIYHSHEPSMQVKNFTAIQGLCTGQYHVQL